MIDIDDRREAEDALRQANALLAAVMEAVPGVIYAKDRDGRILAANRGAADLVGKPLDAEIVGAAGLWTAMIDPGQLENALLNLCINARDAMPDGGKITIETTNKWLDDRTGRERDLPPRQYLSLCVTDTGAGRAPRYACICRGTTATPTPKTIARSRCRRTKAAARRFWWSMTRRRSGI